MSSAAVVMHSGTVPLNIAMSVGCFSIFEAGILLMRTGGIRVQSFGGTTSFEKSACVRCMKQPLFFSAEGYLPTSEPLLLISDSTNQNMSSFLLPFSSLKCHTGPHQEKKTAKN